MKTNNDYFPVGIFATVILSLIAYFYYGESLSGCLVVLLMGLFSGQCLGFCCLNTITKRQVYTFGKYSETQNVPYSVLRFVTIIRFTKENLGS